METHLITAGEVARRAGVVVSTVSKKLKSGKLSYVERTEDGGYLIDPAEAARVFPRIVAGKPENGDSRTPAPEVETLRERLAEKDEIIADLRADRDEWRKQAQTLALSDQRATPAPAPAPETAIAGPHKPAGGVFGFLRSLTARNA